jgi:hypothetical protein
LAIKIPQVVLFSKDFNVKESRSYILKERRKQNMTHIIKGLSCYDEEIKASESNGGPSQSFNQLCHLDHDGNWELV